MEKDNDLVHQLLTKKPPEGGFFDYMVKAAGQ